MATDFALQEIRYSYGPVDALRDVTLTLQPGVTGLLGQNGAGKSTLLRIVAGLTSPDSGSVSVGGAVVSSRRDRSDLRARVGYLPQDARWHGEASVREMVAYFAISRLGRSKTTSAAVDHAIESVGLEHKRNSALRQLSGGETRRAFLAQAIVHDPEIMILDEPTAGLDPVQRVKLRKHVLGAIEGRIVVWATHVVGDLTSFASQCVLLDDGAVRWTGTPEKLEMLGAKETDSSPLGATAGERGMLQLLTQELAGEEES